MRFLELMIFCCVGRENIILGIYTSLPDPFEHYSALYFV